MPRARSQLGVQPPGEGPRKNSRPRKTPTWRQREGRGRAACLMPPRGPWPSRPRLGKRRRRRPRAKSQAPRLRGRGSGWPTRHPRRSTGSSLPGSGTGGRMAASMAALPRPQRRTLPRTPSNPRGRNSPPPRWWPWTERRRTGRSVLGEPRGPPPLTRGGAHAPGRRQGAGRKRRPVERGRSATTRERGNEEHRPDRLPPTQARPQEPPTHHGEKASGRPRPPFRPRAPGQKERTGAFQCPDSPDRPESPERRGRERARDQEEERRRQRPSHALRPQPQDRPTAGAGP
mmetsp:Transcript_31810/g.67776  ORF Transcript_31810/g.67776 Transcript_31810/m.67776 type:complete len:288 (+) Transcript_31810:467-1330(+)